MHHEFRCKSNASPPFVKTLSIHLVTEITKNKKNSLHLTHVMPLVSKTIAMP